jgi:hypothetical protein
MTTAIEAAKLLSTPRGELEKPPAEVEKEGQEAPAKQEATPEVKQEAPETPEAKAESDTETPIDLHKVKVDGEEVEVDYEELKKGYSREQHYQKKAKDLAKDRESIEAKTSELDSKLEDAQLIINDELAKLESPELLALKEGDPEQYLKEVDRINSKVDKFNKLKEGRDTELQAKTDKLVAKEREALLEVFPEWSDPEIMAKEAAVLLKSMEDLGYTSQELENLTDHRMFVLANKAKKLDDIQSANLAAKKEVKIPKAAKPSASQTVNPEDNAVKSAKDKFKKSGSWKDAANLLSIN